MASRSCRELRESITLLLYSPSGPGATAQLCPLEQAPTLRATWGQQPCPKRYCNQVFLSPYGLAASKRGHSAPSSAAEVSCLPPALVFQGHRSLADTSLELSSSYKKGRLTTLSTYRDHLAPLWMARFSQRHLPTQSQGEYSLLSATIYHLKRKRR